MILDDSEPNSLLKDNGNSVHLPPSTRSEDPDGLPAYSQLTPASNSSPSRVVSLSRNRQALAPFSAPLNGLNMYTKRDVIQGSWSLDPLTPQLPTQNLVQIILDGQPGKKSRCRRSKGVPPTAKFSSRHGNIEATLRVVGDSLYRSTATIHSETRKGNTVLDIVSISPMRTVHIDASSRKGSVTLLVPRSFCGLVQLSTRHGTVQLLPALAASGRVISTRGKETTVLLGDGPVPQVGSDNHTDTARIYSRHGRVRLGFSGEDYFTEPPKLMEQAFQLMHKLMLPYQKP